MAIPIDKYEDDLWGAVVSFTYIGPLTQVLVGVGLNIEGTGVWASDVIEVGPNIYLTTYATAVESRFLTGGWLGVGRTVDVLKALQTPTGSLNISGGGMILADWDRDVYAYQGALPPPPSGLITFTLWPIDVPTTYGTPINWMMYWKDEAGNWITTPWLPLDQPAIFNDVPPGPFETYARLLVLTGIGDETAEIPLGPWGPWVFSNYDNKLIDLTDGVILEFYM